MPHQFKPFDAMTRADYAAIGLKCGLEVHRQILTRTKLFCRCPAGQYTSEYHAEILRHMRPTLSELGEYDGTALMEKKTKKNIYYRIHRDTVCTYEFDDTPPFFISEDALDIALEHAMLLRLNLVNELHIARKQYLDGSIPAGFQRTTIFGVNGWIPYKGRRIGIRQLGLEEDSCREVSDIGHDRIYRTDRLGIPLIEIVTEPDMHTPEDLAEVGQILRRLCRSTGKVRTGYGSVRQDVNVSINGGTRIEIKGVPQLWRIPRLVYNEARRQWSLLRIRDELNRRGVTADTLDTHVEEVTKIIAKPHYEPVRAALADGLMVRCVRLGAFGGLLNKSTQEHTNFAKEFSDRVRVIACLTQLPNMVHSDAASESLDSRIWQKLRNKMNATPPDVLILVWGDDRDTLRACEEIIIRAREATIGIPGDTRQGFKDGTNGFERVLAGADRMYPDTDLPPLRITTERLDRVRSQLPEFIWDREDELRECGIPDELVTTLSVSPHIALFFRLVRDLKIDPTFAAVVLCQRFKSFKRMGLDLTLLSDDDVFAVFELFAQSKLARQGVCFLLRTLLTTRSTTGGAGTTIPELVTSLGLAPLKEAELPPRVSTAMNAVAENTFPAIPTKHRFLMGRLMEKLLGRVDGRMLAARLTKQLDQDDPFREKTETPA